MNLGQKIKELRGDMTQTQLARRVGVSQPTIAGYESGETPGPEAFADLCSAFGLEPEDLVDYLPANCEASRIYNRGIVRIAGRVPAGPAHEPVDDEPLGWVRVGSKYARDKYLALQVRGSSMAGPPASIPDGSIVVVERDAVPAPGDVVVAHLADVPGYTIKLFHRERGKRYLTPSSADPDHDRRELGRGDRVVGVVRLVQRVMRRQEG